MTKIDEARLEAAYETAKQHLLAERNEAGHWVGELSTSALSTATAVMALEQVLRDRRARGIDVTDGPDDEWLSRLIQRGVEWLVAHQNDDGGWGDTTKSFSNISTTMLCRAVLIACGDRVTGVRSQESGVSTSHSYFSALNRAEGYIEASGGVPALIARYGKDKTFSVPILTHCALAGLVDWRTIPALPFELACLPAKFYAAVRLPVVSYALPALIAIGQVRHHFAPTRNPVARLLRNRAIEPSLRVLERIQPGNGGFLEATPLTSFVTMSLAGMGRSDHPVAVKGVEFIIRSALPDGSWPIDTNLATWVTTLAVNALGDDLPEEGREPILEWLLGQQYKEVHPYTNAAPGGWAWTDLPGGVPDADDTPGAVLAVMNLIRCEARNQSSKLIRTLSSPIDSGKQRFASPTAFETYRDAGIRWLLDLQNRDGGFPTFCRGWGALPFDRSSPDITAHCLRAMIAVGQATNGQEMHGIIRGRLLSKIVDPPGWRFWFVRAIPEALRFLNSVQHPDGYWLPLWFGNQHAPEEINPTYGTARVLAAFRDAGLADDPATKRGVAWLLANQNEDGGWGALKGTPSSAEETALAAEILCDLVAEDFRTWKGVEWLIRSVECGSYVEPSPIGFYFAKLWYFERLYPVIFTVGALRAARRALNQSTSPGHDRASFAAPN